MSVTTETFIEKAKQIHGNKYDYSKVEYKNAKTKVIIVCSTHGEFEQLANSHISNTQPRGCAECGKNLKKNTTEKFIEDAIKIHGDKYDYSKVNYTKNSEDVIIICKVHGEFLQQPNNHISRKSGCKDCTKPKMTKDEFLEKVEGIHGDYYDYELTEIKTQRDNITIICPTHGAFEQKLSNHLSGSGCKTCGLKSMANKNKSTKEEFIEKAKKIHGSKYDYTDVDYKSVHIHIKIKCITHDIKFNQSPRNHLIGYGCVHCGNEKKMKK
jgi:hypothetical protein